MRFKVRRPRLGFGLLVLLVPLAVLSALLLVRPSGGRQIRPVALNELAQRVRAGEMAEIHVGDDSGVAVTRTGQMLGFQTARGAPLTKVLTSFGVRPDEL